MSKNGVGALIQLGAFPQWVGWRFEQREGKPTKVPINPHTGRMASSTAADTWSGYEEACQALARFELNGVGFVFSDTDPFSGVDLDDCRDPQTGAIQPWARRILDELNSYSEISPSQTGVKVWVKGKLPAGCRNRTRCESGEVEMYSRGRYFATTGWHLEGTPAVIEDRPAELLALHERFFGTQKQPPVAGEPRRAVCAVSMEDADLLDRARRARNGAKFSRL